jgi:hypothetical protein
MSASDQHDRKQQRIKTKGRAHWAKRLVRPRTARFLLEVAPKIAQAFYWVIRLVELFRS